ncbi:MAG: hypothetical protein ACRYG2_03000 [Janthinobacterium lividum]
MNRLMPPPQRDLPDADRREIHANLVRTMRGTTHPRRKRLVVVPALALAGVVVAATAVGLNLPGGSGPTVTGVPAPAGPISTSTARPDQTAGSPAVPAAQIIDSGPLNSSVEKKVVENCLHGSPGGGTAAQVHLARQTSIAGPVVLLTDSVGILHLCRDGMDIVGPSLDAGGPLGETQRPSPTRRLPVVQLTGFAGFGGGSEHGVSGTIKNTATSYYRVGPEVASLQVRLTVDGHTGPWTETIIADGFAWAYASADYSSTEDDHAPDITTKTHVDDRAFDAAGHELDINRIP